MVLGIVSRKLWPVSLFFGPSQHGFPQSQLQGFIIAHLLSFQSMVPHSTHGADEWFDVVCCGVTINCSN